MWVETRWEYLHKHPQWFSKYEIFCLSLAKKMISRLPISDSHFNVWKDIVKIHSTPLIQVERVFHGEFLKLFIIPPLEYSQTNDVGMGFGPGYLAIYAGINFIQNRHPPSWDKPLGHDLKGAKTLRLGQNRELKAPPPGHKVRKFHKYVYKL